ncbi:M15 family metallopeptidase [Riemerella anatipestifer]|uniref:M15 family metallopeptidase n=1 Tax=Riemerella anatipestifer TaxID=34085 RepID=A0AAP3EXG1_RIEAN|nr:M15 family metallopeptidase [Riemerella anatipestifer]MBT0573637.1 M15 family metallopeptidase [Riemerella anatipestifer]MCU7567457.1 M15 family metallopeptidase [Riemerella anatipestifer]MCW0491434.1 M15 family metallopeptidase [Riemerella anatipestifer]MCW0524964.1 M15 family metallopeptidase [Riemerella anatipestifer]MDD1539287.1 M15 family metallopeptidase [Riemerella anatipestifer]
MDKITLQRIELLHPKLREEAKAIYKEICEALTGNAICRFTHTLRTFQEQNDLYAIGRTKKGRRVTNARGGQSYHNYGLAIDICLLVDKDGNGTYETAVWDTKADFDNDKIADWQEIVAIFKRYGWTWGGDWRFTDPPHFQKTFGKSIADLQGLYNRQKTEYVSF